MIAADKKNLPICPERTITDTFALVKSQANVISAYQLNKLSKSLWEQYQTAARTQVAFRDVSDYKLFVLWAMSVRGADEL